jgi:hypothetical protein
MRTQLAKAVRQGFSGKMQQELPQFVKVESKASAPGGLLYKWEFGPGLNFYVCLQLSVKMYQDSFTVELACSKSEFPSNQLALGPNDVRNGSVRFRLPELYREEWRSTLRQQPWWWIGPKVTPQEVTSRAVTRASSATLPEKDEGLIPIDQALPLVEPQVQDAVDRIKRFGVPFFQKCAEAKAHSS